ncbi:MAG: hypothetical protein ACTSRZ_11950 [Promethearchaeota archaeon]
MEIDNKEKQFKNKRNLSKKKGKNKGKESIDKSELKKLKSKKQKDQIIAFRTALKYSEPPHVKIEFNSQNYSRFVAGIILTIIGLVDLALLGAGIGDAETLAEHGTGTWLILGGFSWFYIVGFMPLMVGVGLLVYYNLSSWFGRFGISENNYIFHEKRPNISNLIEIPKKNVEAIQFRNNFLGPKKTWVFVFVPISLYLLLWGIPLFDQPRAEQFTLPTLIVLTVICQIFAMGILIFAPQKYFEIASHDKYYDYWFSPLNFEEDAQQKISKLFDLNIESADLKKLGEQKGIELIKINLNHAKIKDKKISRANKSSKRDYSENENVDESLPKLDLRDVFNKDAIETPSNGFKIDDSKRTMIIIKGGKNYFQIFFGVILIFISILSVYLEMFFSFYFSIVAIGFGVLLVIKGISEDLNDEIAIDIDNTLLSNEKIIKINKKFLNKYWKIRIEKCQNIEFIDYFRKIDIFDVISFALIVGIAMAQIIFGWKYIDWNSNLIIIDVLVGTVLFFSIIFLFILYFVAPIKHLAISNKNSNFFIPIITNRSSIMPLNKRYILHSFRKIYQNKKTRKIFMVRLGTISIIMALFFIIFFSL